MAVDLYLASYPTYMRRLKPSKENQESQPTLSPRTGEGGGGYLVFVGFDVGVFGLHTL